MKSDSQIMKKKEDFDRIVVLSSVFSVYEFITLF
jgi:hypothetical protein